MINLIRPYGFCFGVTNTLNMIKEVRKSQPNAKISLFGAPVHNSLASKVILEETKSVLINEMTLQSDNSILVFSAHGHTKREEETAKGNNYTPIDAICPFLRFRNNQIQEYLNSGYELYVIGDNKHKETIAIADMFKDSIVISIDNFKEDMLPKNKKILIVFQSTIDPQKFNQYKYSLSDSNKQRIVIPICFECQKRHDNIDYLALKNTDFIIVVGDKTSANTTALFNNAYNRLNGRAIIILSYEELKNYVFPEDLTDIYITSGTSASNKDVEDVYNYLTQEYTF